MARFESAQLYADAYRKAKEAVKDSSQFLVVAQFIADRMEARQPLDLDTFIADALAAAPQEA
jgi:hypothetical protein